MSKETGKYAHVRITDVTEQKYKYYISIFITAFVVINTSILVWRIGRLTYWGYIDHVFSFISFERVIEWAIPAIVGMWILSPRFSVEDSGEQTGSRSEEYRDIIEDIEQYEDYRDGLESSDYADEFPDESKREQERIQMFQRTYLMALIVSICVSMTIAVCCFGIVSRLINPIIGTGIFIAITVAPIVSLWNKKSYRKRKRKEYYRVRDGSIFPFMICVFFLGITVYGMYADKKSFESGNFLSVWLHKYVDTTHALILWSIIQIITCLIIILIRELFIIWKNRKIRQLVTLFIFILCEIILVTYGFAAGSWFPHMDYTRFEDEDYLVVCSDADHYYCCKIEYVEGNDLIVDQNKRVILDPNGVILTRIEHIERIRPKHEVIPVEIE